MLLGGCCFFEEAFLMCRIFLSALRELLSVSNEGLAG